VTLPKKIALPDIAREGLTPSELEVLAWIEKLTDIANDLQDEFEQLKQEAAQLRKTRKRE
jgi:hypothetical protein